MLLFRKIERKCWLPPPSVDWLAPDDFVADPLGDLATSEGTLSVWCLDQDCAEPRIAAAISAKRSKFVGLDYFVLDEVKLRAAGFELQKTRGDSADRDLNKRCHHDIVKLSERSLPVLAALFRSSAVPRTYTCPSIMEFLADGIRLKRLQRTSVQKSWIENMVQEGLLPNE